MVKLWVAKSQPNTSSRYRQARNLPSSGKPFSAEPSAARLQHSIVSTAPKQLDWTSFQSQESSQSQCFLGVPESREFPKSITLPGEFPKPMDSGSSRNQRVPESTNPWSSQIRGSSLIQAPGEFPNPGEFPDPKSRAGCRICRSSRILPLSNQGTLPQVQSGRATRGLESM